MYWISSDTDVPDIDKMKERICETMRRGVKIHDVAAERMELVVKSNDALSTLVNQYGIDNPNSPKQVVGFIQNNCDEYVESICFDAKTGKWTSKAECLELLADVGYTWAEVLMEYRKYTKMVENIDSIRSACDANGVIHPVVDILKTNRVSYSKPALMNINKKLIWKLIAPRTDGNQLWSIDIKNQEPWILINMLDIESLKKTMAMAVQKKTGLYRELFYEIYGTDNPSDKQYSEMKRGWNMLTYGGGRQGLGKYCRDIDADKLYRFFNSIPEMKAYKDKTWKLANRNEQAVQTYFGTTVWADKLGFGLQRTLMDLPIQGTGADILSLLIKHFDECVEEQGLEDCIELYFSRHDELIIEVNSVWAEEVGESKVRSILADILEHRIDDWEPFGVEINRVV